jgi:glycosyltransferase involved in cell wall biosynthesis
MAPELRQYTDSKIDLAVIPLMPAEKVAEVLATASVLLFARDGISTRRGTAVAALAHGLPIVAFRGAETAWPLTEAGILFCPLGDVKCLAECVIRIAHDPDLAAELRRKSRIAHERFFAWDKIASRFEDGLLSPVARGA